MQRRRKKKFSDTGKKRGGCCWLAAAISNDLCQQKLSYLKGILFTTISFLTLSKNLFLSHFPSNPLVPNFSATSWKRVVTSAQAGKTGTPSSGTKGNCLFTLALSPKKLFLNFTALEHIPHGLHFRRGKQPNWGQETYFIKVRQAGGHLKQDLTTYYWKVS